MAIFFQRVSPEDEDENDSPMGKRNGTCYALYIAIGQYEELLPLSTSALDIEALGKVLSSEYSVATLQKLVNEDATHNRIRKALAQTGTLSPEDTLLIVFSGHGTRDAHDGMDFWLPCDAGSERLDRLRWLPFNSVLAAMANTPARHVLLINGSTGPSVNIPVTRGIVAAHDYLENALRYRSREIITCDFSAGDALPGLSPCMFYLVDGLHSHPDAYIDSYQIFEYVKQGMRYTEASYMTVPTAGHQDGGSTVLFRTNAVYALR